MAELLPWLNLLLVPTLWGVWNIQGRMSKLEATQEAHGARLGAIDGIRN